MNGLELLYVVPYAPGPVRVRPYSLIRALAARGARITVATVWESERDRADLERLETCVRRIVSRPLARSRRARNLLAALPARVPLQSSYCWHPGLAADIEAAVRDVAYDAICVEHLRAAAYGLRLLSSRAACRAPVVWDSVDCISLLLARAAVGSEGRGSRLVARLELAPTRAYEARLLRRFALTVVTTQQDREGLLELPFSAETGTDREGSPGRVEVVPNGVDLERFRPDSAASGPPGVVVSGKMSYHANRTMVVHLARQIMPRVWRERPDAALWIVGRDPPSVVRRLATIEVGGPPGSVSSLPPRSVVVTGAVEEMRPYLTGAWLAAAPVTYGVGIQNKVLEAMACGLAVVASPQAVSALGARPGRDFVVADEPEAFARSVVEMLAAPERRAALGASARAFVAREHSWDRMAERLEALLREARLARDGQGA